MEYELLIKLSYAAAGVSVVLLIVGIILFFKLDIKNVIGDLSGANRRKAIESIKAGSKTNAKKVTSSGAGTAKTSVKTSPIPKIEVTGKTSLNKSKTDKMPDATSGQISAPAVSQADDEGVTEVLGINALDDSGDIDSETSVLGVQAVSDEDDDSVTSVLGVQTVSEEDDDDGVTSVLGVQAVSEDDDDDSVTSVLNIQSENVDFEDGITFVHGNTIK